MTISAAHSHKLHATVLALSCSFASSGGFAQLLAWTDQNIPSPLAAFGQSSQNLAKLTGNNILLYSHPSQSYQLNTVDGVKSYKNTQFSSASILLKATPEQIEQTFRNYPQFVGLFPTLKKATLLEKDNDAVKVKYRASIPTPIKVLNFNEDVTIQHHYGKNSFSSQIINAPLRYGVSEFKWYPVDATHTLLTLTQWTDADSTKGFLVSTMLKALPEIKLAIPYSSNTFALEALNQRFNKSTAPLMVAGKTPQVKLTPEQLEQVTQISKQSNQPVAFVQPFARIPYNTHNESLRFTQSYTYFKSAPDKAKQLLDLKFYQGLFPRFIRKMQIEPVDSRQNNANITIKVGLGVIAIPFHLKLRQFNPEPYHSHFFAAGGDVKYVMNEMQILPAGTGSLWNMNVAVKIDQDAPFLLRAVRSLPYHDTLPSSAIASVLSAQAKKQRGL